MKNLRSVGALLAISAVLSCATAMNDEGGLGPSSTPTAGSDDSGAGLAEEAGGPAAGGAPAQGGSPAQAGKPDTGKAGSGSAGSGAAGKGSGGTGGTVGAAGAAMGGKAGTSSSGAGGSSAGSGGDGTAGGGTAGPCDNPTDLPGTTSGNSGNIGSTAAACFRTKSTFNTIGCSNFQGRTLKVNGVAVVCTDGTTAKAPFTAAIETWNYFDVSAGTNVSASVYWYTG